MYIESQSDKFIKETFLHLTSKTYPFGYEDEVIENARKLDLIPSGLKKDENGNWSIKIGESKTMFSCHLDTACKEQVGVKHEFNGDFIESDGKSILGADDKAGMTIMLYMIKNKVPGLYFFFFGEECGCVGSGIASKDPMFKEYDKCVAFDRRGTDSIITFQSSKRSCSDNFAKSLQAQFKKQGMGYRLDEGGIYTDSAEFTGVIPECTNISVGYYSEHTHIERQNIKHLQKLAKAVIGIEWDKLVISRNPNLSESRFQSSRIENSNRYSTHCDYDDRRLRDQRTSAWNGYDDEYLGGRNKKKNNKRGNRGQKNKNGRELYSDSMGNLVPVTNNKVRIQSLPNFPAMKDSVPWSVVQTSPDPDRYLFLKEKMLDTRLTAEEVASVKEQFIEPGNKEDMKAFDMLMNYMCI